MTKNLTIDAIEEIKKRAKNGDSEAQYQLGLWVFESEKVTTQQIELLIESCVNINATYTRTWTFSNVKHTLTSSILIEAVSHCDPKVIDILLKAGADVNAIDNNGQTTLMRVVSNWRDNAQIKIKMLLEAGADVNAKDNGGQTALIKIWPWHSEIVDVLLKAGADVNTSDNNGITALMVAVRGNDHKSVDMLIEAGADINAKDNDGKTVLMNSVATWNCSPKNVSMLIRIGANVNIKDNNGRTALMNAIVNSDNISKDEIIKILIDAGAYVNVKDNSGKTALMLGAYDSGRATSLLDKAYDEEWKYKECSFSRRYYVDTQLSLLTATNKVVK